MLSDQSPNLLRNILLLDAVTCLLMGILLTSAAEPLAAWMAIPSALLFYAGLVLLPIAAFMALVAKTALLSRPAVGLIVVGNVLWVIASLWLIVGGAISPNALGYAFVAIQAVAVAILAELEYVASRRIAVAAASA